MSNIENFQDKCIIIRIQEESIRIRGSLYEAARRCWRANINRAKKADYVLVVVGNKGKVEGVLKPKDWYCPNNTFCKENMNECKEKYGVDIDLCKTDRRIAFVGEKIANDKKYLNKTIPAKYIPKQNPIRYCF